MAIFDFAGSMALEAVSECLCTPRLVFLKLFEVCCNNLMHPFVAEFTFLNRKDKSLKLHPFLMFEGTDNRENMTLGQLTQQIKLLDGSKIKKVTQQKFK